MRPELMDSLYMGCVSYSLKYFADGRVEKSAFGPSAALRLRRAHVGGSI